MAESGKAFEKREEEELSFFSRLLEKSGLKDIPGDLRRKLDAWKSVELQVGVIGGSGAGKSTFINAMRRVKPTEKLFAPTGSTECTKELTSYCYPKNPNIKLWDIPGVGTPNFPQHDYLQKIEFDKYDFFIIICSTRFTENDLWIAEEICKKKKKFFFVRTKIDEDLRNIAYDLPNANENVLLEQLRRNCLQNLQAGDFKDHPVFLVFRDPLKHDFRELENKLVSELPVMQREAALFTLRSTSRPFIKKKTEELRNRVWKVALGSAVAGTIPIPGISFAVDAAILNKEIELYKEVYYLNATGLRELSEAANIPEDKLIVAIRENVWFNCTAVELLRDRESLGITVAKESLKLLPIIGSLVGGPLSYATTKKVLHWTIDSMENAALKVLDLAYSEACAKRF